MRQKDEGKRSRIRQAVADLILREGLDGVSVSKIAREAGVSPATIYIYYDNKEEMLCEVFKDFSAMPYAFISDLVDPGMELNEFISALMRGLYRFNVEREEVFSLLEQCSRCPGIRDSICERNASIGVLEMVGAYQKSGRMRDCGEWTAASFLFSTVRFLARNRKFVADEQKALDELVGLVAAALSPEGTAQAPNK